MKYILWDLISPYDGYSETEFDEWDKVVDAVHSCLIRRFGKKGETFFNSWRSGKTPKIIHLGKRRAGAQFSDDDVEIFVTTAPICGPVK